MKPRWQAARAKLATLARALAATHWAVPVLRALAIGAGLALLALIGVAAASPTPGAASTPAPVASASTEPTGAAPPLSTAAPPPLAATSMTPTLSPTADEPVVLNVATAEELQRLPGIGPKKAQAILALRQRMGRFRQVEDLMKVKGIGRATIKRLRPKVRIDPLPQPAPQALPGQADASAP